MTYIEFHFVFILPPILLLATRRPWHWNLMSAKQLVLNIGLISLIAVAYTTPWDNYLIYKGVWTYDENNVGGRIGYVPVEEYLFFVLQSVLTGFWFFLTGRHFDLSFGEPLQIRWRMGVFILGSIVFGVSVYFLFCDETTYLGLILAWASPVLTLQFSLGGSSFFLHRRIFLTSVLVPTVFLWICDAIAIEMGIWAISEKYTIGFSVLGLPLEEAVFFLTTNLLVVCGLWLLIAWQLSQKKKC